MDWSREIERGDPDLKRSTTTAIKNCWPPTKRSCKVRNSSPRPQLQVSRHNGLVPRNRARRSRSKTLYHDRYKKLLAAYKAVVQSPDLIAKAAAASLPAQWIGPEKSSAAIPI